MSPSLVATLAENFLLIPQTHSRDLTKMLSGDRRRPNLTAGDQFSFFPVSDHLEYGAWAENLKRDDSFGEQNRFRRFGPWSRTIRLPESASSGEISFDASSPPLWKSSSPDCNPSFSRAKMIDNHRKEMMDLVRNLPETTYELSLKDLVELIPIQRKGEEKEEEEEALTERWEKKKGRGKRSSSRNGSLYSGGFLLKLFMPSVPAVFGCSRKISPRPIAVGSDSGWINGGFRERTSSSGSSNSSSCGRGRKRWTLGGCYPFLYGFRRSRSR